MKLYFSNGLSLRAAISTIPPSSLQNKTTFSGSSSGQTLVSGGTNGTGVEAVGASTSSSSRDTTLTLSRAARVAPQFQAQRLNDMQNALTKLRDMPSANVSAKQAASERAAMLKKRLDMMKQMMIWATPAQAKAMAAQLKDIAKELASMGVALSGGGSASAVTASSEPVALGVADMSTILASSASPTPSPASAGTKAKETGVAASDTGGSPAITHTHEIQAGRGHQTVAAYAAQDTRNAKLPQSAASNNGVEKAANDSLKKALGEAIKSLRAVISMIKSKVGASNKDMKETEGKLAELWRSMARAENQNAHESNLQGLLQGSVAQGSGLAEAATGTASCFVETAGGISSGISIGDTWGAVGGNISVSA